jgi:cytoskeleton protein RodZ
MSTAASNEEHQLPLPNMDAPLGLRLRRAREHAGLSVADVAEKLRLKSATVDAIEREDFDTLGAAVYVRGYFNSYARLVGLPLVLVDSAFKRETAPMPELRTTARVSHSRFLFDRYAKRAVYVVMTAAIVVPVIFLATSDQLPRPGATLTPLESPVAGRAVVVPVPGQVAALPRVDGTEFGPPAPAEVAAPRSAAENPVVASLTPFYKPQVELPPVAPPAGQGLVLQFTGASWVEVLGHDGRRLAYGLLQAGTSREFAPGSVARVSLGNANAVQVRMNGAAADISAYRRANVARFTVSSQGTLAPAGG